ncbi:YheC/YheD family protein [Paenibacillus sp. LHD-117]|uniref:YheC/YheD family protein n=1 Tax=Paenibacillus sp. LHD-117 TaxID=3071412 RepID=UPI0027E1BA0F|nr:YheC/YheD family protein [Paenibacillus sp. LHD-117]MDQ6418440.1 YheC/YheD family protein [Paenibacillus sp. LHD-117]
MQTRSSLGLIGICVLYPRHDLIKMRILWFGDNDVDFVRFGPNDIRFEEGILKGFKAEKDELRGTIRWIEGDYPIPDVIYLDGRVDLETVRIMEQAVGRKVFNSFIFDKLQGQEFLKRDEMLSRHLPDACSALEGNRPNPDLERFLRLHRNVYMKPTDGCSGKGIIRVKLDEGGQVLVSRFEHTESVTSYPCIQMWIAELKLTQNYIVQRTVSTVKWYGLPTDIRLNMTKNGVGEWDISFLISRAALTGDYNKLNQYQMLLRRDFAHLFSSTKKSCEEIEADIIKVGRRICAFFDESDYHMGDLGIDLGVDEAGEIWIFEVNPLPYPYNMAIGDRSLVRPLEYARYLALQA